MGKLLMDKFFIFICLDLMMTCAASERQYFILPMNFTWEMARSHCQVCYKDLVTMTPENTNLIAQRILNTSSKYWIGLRKTFEAMNESQSAYNFTFNSTDDDDYGNTSNSTDSSPTMAWTRWVNGDPLSFQNWYPGWPAPKFPLPKIDCCSCSCTCPASNPGRMSPTNGPLTATLSPTSGTVKNSPSTARTESSTNFGTKTATGFSSLPKVTDTSVTDSTGPPAATTESNVNSYTDFTDISSHTNVTDMSNVTDSTSTGKVTGATSQSVTKSTRSWASTYTSQITTPYSANTRHSHWRSQQGLPIESTCERSPIMPPVIPEPYDNYIEDSCVAMLSFGPWIEKNCFESLPFICYEDVFIGNVNVTNITSKSASLSWLSPPGGSIYYRIDVNDKVWVNSSTNLTLDLLNLTSGTHYSVQVFPMKCDRDLNPQNASFYTVPLKVGNLRVTNVTATSVSLNWSRPDGNLDFYSIRTGTLVGTNTSESFEFANLNSGTCYTFTVLTGVADKSRWSEESNVVAYTKPGKPYNLSVSDNTDTKLKLTWNTPDGGFTGFVVEAYNSNNTRLFNGTTEKTPQIQVYNLSSGDNITLYVTAVANYTLLGETASTVTYTTPDPISDLVLTTDSNSLNASWKYAQNSKIFFIIDCSDSSGNKISTPANNPSAQFKSLKTGDTYNVTVYASNGVHPSPGVWKTKTTLPNPPTLPRVESKTTNSLTFVWSPPDNAGSGLLYDISIVSSFWNTTQNYFNISQTNYTFGNLSSGTKYNLSVLVNAQGLKSASVSCSEMTVSVEVTVGLSMMCSSNSVLLCDNSSTRADVFQALKTHIANWLGTEIIWSINRTEVLKT